MSELPIETSTDDVAAHPKKTGHGWLDLVLALTAIFISAVSLYVAIEHGKTERDLVAGSTWPSLGAIYSNEWGDKKDVAIGITNDGVGPAKVKWIEVSYKGTPVASNNDLLRRCCGLPSDLDGLKAALPAGYDMSFVDQTVLRPGDNIIMLGVHRLPETPEISNRLAAALNDVSLTGCYCSVLDQCWTGNLKTTDTTPVKTCPAADHPFDPDGK